jgi:nucleotide-binding universal stress UspA family protein
MYDKVIVGFDGTDQGLDALELGRSLASACGTPLSVAYIYEEQPSFHGATREYGQGMRARIQEMFSRARTAVGDDVKVETVSLGASSRIKGFSDVAKGGTNLLVVGSTHHGSVGRVVIGGFAEQLLAAGGHAVAVAPYGLRDAGRRELGVVGVAFDGSNESRVALQSAAAVASAAGAKLRVISVRKRGKDGGIEAKITEALADAGAGDGADRALLEGNPVECLLKAAEETDLLVTGARGQGTVRKALGSVSTQLARQSPCPVLVTPPGAKAPAVTAASAGAQQQA